MDNSYLAGDVVLRLAEGFVVVERLRAVHIGGKKGIIQGGPRPHEEDSRPQSPLLE